MSVNNPTDRYTPPPAPRRGLSPWAWTGIGCGVFVLVGLGGCIAFTASLFNGPWDREKELAALNMPVYPGAQVDETVSRSASGTFRLMKGLMKGASMHLVAFRAPDEPSQVISFYETKLSSMGYSPAANNQPRNPQVEQRMYQMGNELVMVQVQPQRMGKMSSLLTLMRMSGLNDRAGKPGTFSPAPPRMPSAPDNK